MVGRVFAIAQTRKLQIELRWQWLIGNKEGKSMRNKTERRERGKFFWGGFAT